LCVVYVSIVIVRVFGVWALQGCTVIQMLYGRGSSYRIIRAVCTRGNGNVGKLFDFKLFA